MPTPNLINHIPVEIEQIKEDKTVYSNRRREPSNRVKRSSSFKINSQIFFEEGGFLDAAKKANPDSRNLGGSILNAIGYIVVRKRDLVVKGKILKIGDKITSYGKAGKEIQCEYFLIGTKDAATYSSTGQATLEKWFFEDRN